jgi:hypothetical protein
MALLGMSEADIAAWRGEMTDLFSSEGDEPDEEIWKCILQSIEKNTGRRIYAFELSSNLRKSLTELAWRRAYFDLNAWLTESYRGVVELRLRGNFPHWYWWAPFPHWLVEAVEENAYREIINEGEIAVTLLQQTEEQIGALSAEILFDLQQKTESKRMATASSPRSSKQVRHKD